MNDAKFDLLVKNNYTGDFHHKKYSLTELMGGVSKLFDFENYETITNRLFTGSKDSNGNEIYSGDIVQFSLWWFDGNVAESLLTGTIVYCDAVMSFQLKGVKNEEWERFTGHENDTEYLTPFSELTFEDDDFSVIGNIYENPELLLGG